MVSGFRGLTAVSGFRAAGLLVSGFRFQRPTGRFRIQDSGFRFQVSGQRGCWFQASVLLCSVSGLRFQRPNGRFRIQDSGFRIQVSSFKFQVSGFKFQVSGFRFQVSRFRFRGLAANLDFYDDFFDWGWGGDA